MLSTQRRTPRGNTPREGSAQCVDALLALSCLVVSCLLGYALLYWIVDGLATEIDAIAACVAAVGSSVFGFFGIRRFCCIR